MIEPTSDIARLADLLSALDDLSSSTPLWYRGQSDVSWALLPRLARQPNGLKRESALLARFKQNASLLLPAVARSDWEWLAIMQHYRAPTRLLDWTESPLVALYFAVVPHTATDGALWVLDPARLNLASHISPDDHEHIPSFDDPITTNYLPSSLRAEQMTRLGPIAVIGPRNTPQMQAQLGAFTVIHRTPTPIEQVGDQQHVRQFRIPAVAKCGIRAELSLLAIDNFQLFPDLQTLGNILGGLSDA